MDTPKPTWKISSKLRSNARTLRRNSTDAERILWSELRDHRLAGAGFRRQVPIDGYIADFVCHAARLVIELDGGQHDWQQASDAMRTRRIEAAGYRVLRFWNHDVIGNLEGVLSEIQRALPPTPDPSPQGGGEPRQRAKRAPRLSRKERN